MDNESVKPIAIMIQPRFSFLLFLSFLLVFSSCATTRQAPSVEPVTLTILHLNDVYEISPLEGGQAGGLARVATLKQQLLREDPNTIALLSGDFLSPSLIGNLKKEDGERIAGQQMVETLNAMGLDYATFGNHEFDLKTADLLQKRILQSNFEYTVCNAFRADSSRVRPFVQNDAGELVPPFLIRTFRNAQGQEVKVGILGVVLPFNQADYVHYEPVVVSFRETVEELRPKVDVIVAMTHLNEADDLALAEEVPGVALFMGGHDHHHMSHYVGETVIAKADANAKTAYVHRITWYPSSGVSKVNSTLVPINPALPDDPSTAAVVEKWQENVGRIMGDQGYSPGEILMDADPPLECQEVVVRRRQTNYGNLVLRAFEAAAPGADVYLINSGSMRLDDNISGAVTQYDVLRTLPFGGGLVRMALPGEVLKKVLDIGEGENRGEGGYLQRYRAEKEGEGWLINGQPLKAGQRYAVVLPAFVAAGNEANLEFLKDYKQEQLGPLVVDGASVRNDVRDLTIAYMRFLGK